MNVFFIVNENAGNGRGKKIWTKLKKKLNFPYTTYITEYPKHAIDIVKHLAKRHTETCLVVGVGGDGTLSEVTSGAAGLSNIVVSAIKAGSGNDFARGYKVFHYAKELNNYVAQQQLNVKENNIGYVTSDCSHANFVNNTGFGFDALVTTTVNRSNIKKVLNKIGLGQLAYVLLTIKLLFTYKKYNAKVSIDGKSYVFSDIWFIAICNQPYFGGGMKISPRSKMDDKQFEFVIVQYLSPLKLLLLFLSVFVGKHEKLKEIQFITAQSIELEFDREIVSHVDGDLFEKITPQQKIVVNVSEKNWKLAK